MENETNSKNLILAVVLSVIVFLGWNHFMAPPASAQKKANVKKEVNKTPDKANSKDNTVSYPTKNTNGEKDKKVNKEKIEDSSTSNIDYNQKEEFVTLENKDIEASFSTYGASLKSLNLKGKKYTLDKAKKEQIYTINESDKNFYSLSFSIIKNRATYLKNYAPFKVTKKDKSYVVFTFQNKEFKITKTYKLNKKYSLTLNVKIENVSSSDLLFTTITKFSSYYDHRVEKTNIFGKEGKTFFYKTSHGDFERVKSDDFKEPIVKKELTFVGVDDRYFISLIKPSYKDTLTFKINKEVIKKDAIEDVRFTFGSEPYKLNPNKSIEYSYELYNGPKILENLKALGANDGIDYGIFAVISRLILWLLLFLYGFLGNYGVALIVLTLIVKLALYPLTKSSYASMHKMKKLKPEMDKLKEKYGKDKEKIGRETMALYKKHGVSPLGGCLPMLLQMPIWFGLYRAIQYSVELYNEPFVLWIQDLSVSDPYYILPITMGILMFFQQKMSSAGMDQTQAKIMLYTMPVLFSFFMINLPSGLVLYIWVNTLVSILQQNYINKKLDREDANTSKNTKKAKA